MKTSGKYFLVVLAFCITANKTKAIDNITLEDALRKRLIQLEIKSKGGHLGDVIEMKIKKGIRFFCNEYPYETGRH